MSPVLRILGILIASAGWSAASAVAQEDRDPRFRFVRDIETAPFQREELIAVPLDSDVFQEAQRSLADLRVEGPVGTWNSFLIQTRRGAKERRTEWTDAAEKVSLRTLPEGGLEIRFTANPKRSETPSELRIVTALRDFEQRVRVFDDAEGTPLRDDAVIFDYSRFMDVRETSIPLPAGRHRRFRIVIDTPTSEQVSELKELSKTFRGGVEETTEERRGVLDRPFRIERIELRGVSVAQQDRQYEIEAEYPVLRFRSEEDRETRETILTFETRRTPTSRLELDVEGRNFSRAATVEASLERGGRTEWSSIGSATLTRFDFRGEKKEQRSISVQPGAYETLRVRIANRDNSPLKVTGVRLIGPESEAIFLGEPGTLYRMHYGAEIDKAPDYDVVAIRSALGTSAKPVAAKLGAVQPGTTLVGAPPTPGRRVLNDPLVLGAVIVMLIALLGFALLRAGRAVSALPAEGEASPPSGSSEN